MWTPDGWVIPMPVGLAEDLAWSLVMLSSAEGLARVSFRSLARHTRMAPGTITNHYASRSELLGVCATVVGRWLADATSAHVDERGPVGLFPMPEDRTYCWLVCAWAQLRSHALTDAEVDERVRGATFFLERVAGRALGEDSAHLSAALSCLETLRQDLVRPGNELNAAGAWAVLRPLTAIG
jgi:AcrR family transcriptional regulator